VLKYFRKSGVDPALHSKLNYILMKSGVDKGNNLIYIKYFK